MQSRLFAAEFHELRSLVAATILLRKPTQKSQFRQKYATYCWNCVTDFSFLETRKTLSVKRKTLFL
jgi:hypothetical protein